LSLRYLTGVTRRTDVVCQLGYGHTAGSSLLDVACGSGQLGSSPLVVATIFGAMSAPRPALVATELVACAGPAE
jgi:hypothetical protein